MLTVDQTSLDQAMADANYQLKSRMLTLLSPASLTMKEVMRFRSMLSSDPAHMMPNEQSLAVSTIQTALGKILMPGGHISHGSPLFNEMLAKRYGSATQAHVVQLKTKHQIRNAQGMIDPIVGKKTIRAIDFILHRNGK
jgi:hypothetical protein